MSDKPILAEIAITGDGRDITEPWFGELLLPRDEILLQRGGGDLALYESVMRDDQVKSCWQQRVLALIGREWLVEPGGPRRIDRYAADFVRAQLQHVKFDALTAKMLSGVFYGYAVAECLYAADGGQIVLDRVKVRRAKRFRFDRERRLRLITRESMLGEVMPERKFWTYAAGADDDDDPYGRGLAYWLYWLVYFKRHALKFWAVWTEKFASPTRLGKHPPGASEEERRKLLAAMRAIVSDSAVAVPENVEISLLEAVRSAGADYDKFLAYLDAGIAKVILSQTMTTQEGGSLAQAKVHQEVKLELVRGDADLVCESLTDQPVAWLTAWNFPDAAPPRVWRDVEEPEDLKARADRDKVVFDMGYRPTPDYVRETYGEGWEPRESAGAAVLPPAGGAGDAVGGGPAFGEPAQDGCDAVDALVARTEQAAAPALDAMIGQILGLVMAADSMEDLAARLLALRPDLAAGDLAEVLAKALALAELTGRHDLAEGR